MYTLSSSCLSHASYCPASSILTVRFTKSGCRHSYADVPAEKVSRMLAAPSIGRFFNLHVKPWHKATALAD